MLCPGCWGSKTTPGSVAACGVCNATGSCADVRLSPHFLLSEMVHSDTAVRKHLPNVPSAAHIANLTRLCVEVLEPIREQFDALHVTSGLRVPALNGSIAGSAKRSAHEEGWAADLVPIRNGVTLKSIVDWVIASSLEYDQVIYEGTWVHVARFSPDGTRARKLALMMFKDANGDSYYSPYNPADPRVV